MDIFLLQANTLTTDSNLNNSISYFPIGVQFIFAIGFVGLVLVVTHLAQVAAQADGVVVGSALVNIIRDGLGSRSAIAAALGAKVSDLAAGTSRK